MEVNNANKPNELKMKNLNDLKTYAKNNKPFFENPIGENSQSDPFLSPEKAARYLDVSRKFIYEMIAQGQLKALTVGGRLRRIRLSDLEAWLTSSNQGVQP